MTEKALIRRIQGKLYFMFQVCELRKRQLVEATVRLYTARYESLPLGSSNPSDSHGPIVCQTYAMRLTHPNDELGSKLLLSTPQIIVHEIDDFSPLLPPVGWTPHPPQHSDYNFEISFEKQPKENTSYLPSAMAIKSPRSRSCSLNSSEWDQSSISSSILQSAPLAHYSFSAHHINSPSRPHQPNLIPLPTGRRCQYSFPGLLSRNSPSIPSPSLTSDVEERKDIIQFMIDSRLEIVVLIEGVDPLTSHAVQAFHSYGVADIEWDSFFAPCTLLEPDGWTVVDFTKFHKLVPVANDAIASPSHC